MSRFSVLAGVLLASMAQAEPSTANLPVTSLAEAQARALAANPDVAQDVAEQEALEAESQQAGRWSNPELAVTRENMGGDRPESDSPETVIALEQTLELGGQSGKRRAVAEARAQGHKVRLSTRQRLLALEAAYRWQRLLIALSREASAHEALKLTADTVLTIREQVRAGKLAAPQALRAQVAEHQARLRLSTAAAAIQAARTELAALWGGATHDIKPPSLSPSAPLPVASLEQLDAWLAEAPATQQRVALEEERRATLQLAQAERLPDITVGVGVRQFERFGDQALEVGVRLPLPLLDRRQGEVAAARARLQQSTVEQQAGTVRDRETLRTLHSRLTDLEANYRLIQEQMLPAAEESFAASLDVQRYGKVSLLELLDAQSALMAARDSQLDTLAAWLDTRFELARLLGRDPVPESRTAK
jgi:cobalt-zinc-cadmium efflux system outer membrane protein